LEAGQVADPQSLNHLLQSVVKRPRRLREADW